MTVCPGCGSRANGNFCAHCGAALGSAASPCPGCGAPLPAGQKFCASCGARAGSNPFSAERLRALWPFALGAVLLGGVLVLVARKERVVRQAAAVEDQSTVSPSSGPTPPDISSLTPRQRFDRLYDRVMRASEAGDEATVTQFGPMALAAYAQLDSVDTDARYHAALLHFHLGDPDGGERLGDTIATTAKGHLFGFVVRGMGARVRKDSAAMRQAYREFTNRYETEIARGLEEYTAHKALLERFLAEAKPTSGAAPPPRP